MRITYPPWRLPFTDPVTSRLPVRTCWAEIGVVVPTAKTALAAAADAVVFAVPTDRTGGSPQPVIDAHRTIIEARPATRLLVVGGAGSLEVGDHRLKDEPGFPEAYKPEATAFTQVFFPSPE